MSLRSRLLLYGQELIEEKKRGRYLRPILFGASFIWRSISFIRNKLYDLQILPSTRATLPVVSIGNIVAGGTGKTPLALLLAKTIGNKPAILSRGYGGGDEAELLKRRGCVVYCGKNRAALAEKAALRGAKWILLDDGFQHRSLQRGFDLVLLRASDPFGKGRFLPSGFLRDSPKRLQIADAIFVCPIQSDLELAAFATKISPYSSAPLIGLSFDLLRVVGGEVSTCGIFSGIGNPDSFKKTVVYLGANIVDELRLADHQPIGSKQLAQFAERCRKMGAKSLICTEKDWVKLPQGTFALPIYYLEMEMRVSAGKEQWQNLIEKIAQKMNN